MADTGLVQVGLLSPSPETLAALRQEVTATRLAGIALEASEYCPGVDNPSLGLFLEKNQTLS